MNPYSIDYDSMKNTNRLLKRYWSHGEDYTQEQFKAAIEKDKKRHKLAIGIVFTGLIIFCFISSICIGITIYASSMEPSMTRAWFGIAGIVPLLFTIPYAIVSYWAWKDYRRTK